MRVRNLFVVRLPVDEAWEALLETVGDGRTGVLRVKVGAVAVEYHGSVQVKEADEGGRRILAYASGVEAQDQSAASATVVATLAPSGGGTAVTLETELSVAGRLAAFGSGVLTDASTALVKDFAARLEAAPVHREPAAATPTVAATAAVTAPSSGDWLPAATVGVLVTMAATKRSRARWALAAAGAALVLAAQRRPSRIVGAQRRPSRMAAVRGS